VRLLLRISNCGPLTASMLPAAPKTRWRRRTELVER